jgi:hypothetical protein
MIKFYQFGHWNVGFFSCAEQSNTKLFKYYMEQNPQEDCDTDDVRNDDDEHDDDEDDKYKHKDDLRSEITVAKVNRRVILQSHVRSHDDFCRHDYGHRYKMISRFIRM